MIKIGFIENNDLLRNGLTMCFNDQPQMEVCFSKSSCKNLLNEISQSDINHLILDTLEDNDFMIIRQIQREHPELKVILLSSESRLVENYLFYSTHPTDAILYKTVKLELLIDTILTLDAKRSPKMILPGGVNELVPKVNSGNSFFSKRECTILSLIGKGKTNKEASEILNLSYRTIESHRRRMIEKLGCKNIIPVILFALEKKWIKVERDEMLFWT